MSLEASTLDFSSETYEVFIVVQGARAGGGDPFDASSSEATARLWVLCMSGPIDLWIFVCNPAFFKSCWHAQ